MPAPNIATLYNFESAYEDAASAHLANISGISQVLTPRTNIAAEAYAETPRATVVMAIQGHDDQAVAYANASDGYADNHWRGVLSVDLATARNSGSQNHGLLRGAIRNAILNNGAVFSNTALPYYQTLEVMDAGSAQTVDPENDEIITRLSFNVTFFIPSASFP